MSDRELGAWLAFVIGLGCLFLMVIDACVNPPKQSITWKTNP